MLEGLRSKVPVFDAEGRHQLLIVNRKHASEHGCALRSIVPKTHYTLVKPYFSLKLETA